MCLWLKKNFSKIKNANILQILHTFNQNHTSVAFPQNVVYIVHTANIIFFNSAKLVLLANLGLQH